MKKIFLLLVLFCGVLFSQTKQTIVSATAGDAAGGAINNAFDGNTGTKWGNSATLANAWIIFDLGSSKTLSSIRLLMYNGATRTYPIRIQVDNNANPTTSVWTGSTTLTAAFQEIPFTATGRYVKLTMTAANGNGSNYFSIYEAELYSGSGAIVAPSITAQPTSKTVTAPATATFTVVATGTAPLTYQWQKNTVNITGATSASYTTPTTAVANNGDTYRVIVSNASSTVATSNNATLTVNSSIPNAWNANATTGAIYYTNGNVGIGTSNPQSLLDVAGKMQTQKMTVGGVAGSPHTDYALSVKGKLVAKEMYITVDNWADFVFDDNYKLMPLNDLKAVIKKDGKLPGVPSEQEVQKDGIDIKKLNVTLLQKVEELTLYLIDLEKENKELNNRLNSLESKY